MKKTFLILKNFTFKRVSRTLNKYFKTKSELNEIKKKKLSNRFEELKKQQNLPDIKMIFSKKSSSYIPKEKTITINNKDIKNENYRSLEYILLHEFKHALQCRDKNPTIVVSNISLISLILSVFGFFYAGNTGSLTIFIFIILTPIINRFLIERESVEKMINFEIDADNFANLNSKGFSSVYYWKKTLLLDGLIHNIDNICRKTLGVPSFHPSYKQRLEKAISDKKLMQL